MRWFPVIEKRLLILKALLFGYYGALGSLWPFLTLHMMQLGLTLEETAVINMVLPFVAAACKPAIGVIADKTGKYKLLLAILLIITGAVYTSLLLIAPVVKIEQELPPLQTSLTCSPNGSHLLNENCLLKECNNQTTLQYSIRLHSCSHLCENYSWPIVQNPTKMCFQNNNRSDCISPSGNDTAFQVSIDQCHSIEEGCVFNIQHYKYKEERFTELKCPSSFSECDILHCESVVQSSDVRTFSSSKSKTFWTYLILRSIAEMLLSACYPLTDIINLSMCSQFGAYFGQQQLFGIFALGLFGPITGAIVDHIKNVTGEINYAPCFYMFDFLVMCTVIFISLTPIEVSKPQTKGTSMTRGLFTFLANPVVVLLFGAALLMGIIWGFMETFLYWYLLENGASRMLIGLTQFISVIPALPLLYASNWIIKKFGHANLIILAFFVYSLRCVGYVFLKDPWWSLLLESTRVFSLYLARLSFTMYANSLAPPALKVTIQAFVFLLHFDIGRGVGSLVGGFLMEEIGSQKTFQVVAVYAGTLGCLYFSLHHFYLKRRPTSSHENRPKNTQAYQIDVPPKSIQNRTKLPSDQQEPLLLLNGDFKQPEIVPHVQSDKTQNKS